MKLDLNIMREGLSSHREWNLDQRNCGHDVSISGLPSDGAIMLFDMSTVRNLMSSVKCHELNFMRQILRVKR